MQSKIEKLPNSRIKISITADKEDLTHATKHAVEGLTAQVSVKGFRPGKAPKAMLIAQVGKGRILSEIVDHALPELLQQAAEKEKLTIIETPKYTLEKLCELDDDGTLKEGTRLTFLAEADVSPDVTVGDYKKIKAKLMEPKKVTDKTIDDVLNELAERRVDFKTVDRAAKEGDRVEIDFAGKRNGLPEERLASKNHPIVLGSKSMIPGFEDKLVGKKASDKLTFEIQFPADYHAKDLANEKVIFDVTIHTVSERNLPVIDDNFAKEFGQKSLDELKKAIWQEREFVFAEEAKEKNDATVLEAFLPLVKLEIPQSLVERELDRQLDVMRQQARSYGLSFEHYLEHMKKTEEQLRDELRPTAEKAVKIGLGLGEVVKGEKIESKENPGRMAIDCLVAIAGEKN
jgi:trigger factor